MTLKRTHAQIFTDTGDLPDMPIPKRLRQRSLGSPDYMDVDEDLLTVSL